MNYRVLILLTFIFSTSCTTKKQDEVKLTSIPVTKGTFKKEIKVEGNIRPVTIEDISISSELWGTIEKMAPEGSKVKKGDLIAKINVRDVINENNGMLERAEMAKFDTEKQKAELPLEIKKLELENQTKENNFRTKSLDYVIEKRGPKDDIKEKALVDIKVNQLKKDSVPIEKKKMLYKNGYISEQELNTSDMEFKNSSTELEKAKISKTQLSSEYRKYDIKKNLLTKEKSKFDLDINKLEKEVKIASLNEKTRNSIFKTNHYQKQNERLQKKIEMATLYSPIDGIVLYPKIWGWKKVFLGMEVWSGFPFLQVSQTDKVKIETKVNELEIANVKKGAKVEISLSSIPNKVFMGKVTNISKLPKVKDERNPQGMKYFDVDIETTSNLDVLKTNMTVDLKIISLEQNNAIFIPLDAITEENKKSYVLFDENNNPVKKEVKIIEQNQDYAVLSGTYTGQEKVFITK